MHAEFDPQPSLSNGTLHANPLRQADFAALYAAASDPLIWAGHPAKDRHQEEVFASYFSALLESGVTLAIRHGTDARIIGCSRFYTPPEDPAGVAIGYTFLARSFWAVKPTGR